ncbi:hypothetical protein OO013_08590 [Mangrovivirga sp. M17]|uniref:Fibronectin type-III domain-containing protein n=1 Tax=Mangrovivirga halotolerans TaxID=2993936 RepID=A0ABT3RQ51_9BACT|nr:hypothetical protein [Mangrovivirga halotolerans]MCX2743921.1 hypothetical protein [Mangrovivirga halotolerans]
MNFFTNFFTGLFLLIIFVGCSPLEEGENKPANTIIDSDGVNVVLEWTTGGTVTESYQEADLDLYIGTTNSAANAELKSTGYGFEQIEIGSIYADKTYYVMVKYFSGTARADYTIYVQGLSPNGETLTYDGYFLSDDDGLISQVITITKNQDRYSIVD